MAEQKQEQKVKKRNGKFFIEVKHYVKDIENDKFVVADVKEQELPPEMTKQKILKGLDDQIQTLTESHEEAIASLQKQKADVSKLK